MAETKTLRMVRIMHETAGLKRTLPRNYKKWCEKNIWDNYIIYDAKEKTARCNACMTDFSTKKIKLKHNNTVNCPVCKKEGIVKSLGLIKNGFEEIKWSEILDVKDEKTIYIRYIRHFRKYNHNGEIQNEAIDNQIREIVDDFCVSPYFCYNDGWDKWRHYMNEAYTTPSEFFVPRCCKVYGRCFEKKLSKTIYKNAGLDALVSQLSERWCDPNLIADYLCSYAKNPWYEKLIKVGMLELVDNFINYGTGDLVDVNGNRLNQVLKLTVEELRTFKKLGPNKRLLNDIHNFRKYGFGEEEYKILNEASETYYAKTNKHPSVSDIEKLVNYGVSPKKALRMYNRYGTTYTDYLRMAKELNLDMKLKKVLYPKDVNQAHDEIMNQLEIVKNEKMNAALKLAVKRIENFLKKSLNKKIFSYENKKYKILIPCSSEDFVKESVELGHCVKSYRQQVAEGKTNILFIRRKECEDKSYFTLEYKNGKIVQLRGKGNCEAPADVRKFVEGFIKKINKGAEINKVKKIA